MRVQNVVSTFYNARESFISNDSRFGSWVLVAPENGEFAFQTQNQSGTCAFGAFVCAAQQQKFERRVLSPNLTYHVLRWQFARSDGDWREGLHTIRDRDRLRATLARFRPLLTQNSDWAHARRENLLEELLLLALEPALILPSQEIDPLWQRAAQLLRDHASQPFSMRLISDAIGLSPVAFTRGFKGAWGENPIEFLTRVRLEIAAQKLIETDATLETIARECGYSSPFYLSALFSRVHGTSPREFRRKHRI